MREAPGNSDEALYEACASGSVKAFEAMYRRYEKPLFGFILQYVGNRQEAEEIFHEVFLAVLNGKCPKLVERGFRPWIYRVARNLSLNRLRSRAKVLPLLSEGRGSEPVAPVFTEELLSYERSVAVEQALVGLAPHHAEVYQLRAAGASYDEMACRLGIPTGTVKSRLHEALTRLKEVMKKWDVN